MSKTSTTAKTTSTSVSKTKAQPKVTLKNRIDSVIAKVRGWFDNMLKRLGFKSKKAKKNTKNDRKLARQQKIRGIIGIGLLFVVVSIAYSTYMTNLFVDGPAMVAALVPQVAFAVVILIIAFYKLFK